MLSREWQAHSGHAGLHRHLKTSAPKTILAGGWQARFTGEGTGPQKAQELVLTRPVCFISCTMPHSLPSIPHKEKGLLFLFL